jgi:predicted nucleotidyltransferase
MIDQLEKIKQELDKQKIQYKAIYLYGSQVYGTSTESSDWDFLVITFEKHKLNEDAFKYDKINSLTFETEEAFLNKLLEHDIRSLECIMSQPKYKMEVSEWQYKIDQFTLNLIKLRQNVSAKSSNSWVKAKKKIEVESEEYIGQKSLFHSLRMLDFAIQIASHKKIQNFGSSNHYWCDIKTIKSWKDLKEKYQPIYNSLKTEFRKKTT